MTAFFRHYFEMVVSMLAAMLLRRAEYTGHVHQQVAA